ncbi:MAG: ABC transporter substrate-binding protein [Acidimicrobiaceae bacterium]|nr:ABC transporter substrate-binding protein [Acidimicrobiaceae bacterium]
MKFSKRLLLLLLALSLVAASCGGDDDAAEQPTAAPEPAPVEDPEPAEEQPAEEPAEEPAEPAAPDVDRTLRVAVAALPVTLDPEFAPGQESVEIITTVLDSLFWFEAEPGVDGVRSATELAKGDAGMVPGLVESFEVSDDNLTYTLNLRQGVMSAAGNEFTSEDVRWMLARNFGVAVIGAFVVGIAKIPSMDAVTVIDDYTVEISITTPNPLLLRALQLQTISPVDSTVAKEMATDDDPWATEWMQLDTMGFGPYYVDEFTPGVQLVLKSNKNYWRGEPFFEEIIYREIPDSSQRLTLLRQGEVDIAENLSSRELESLGADEGKTVSVVRNQVIFGAMNTLGGPTADAKVRQALQYALNSDQIVSSVYEGNAKALRLVAPEEYPGYNAGLWPYPTGGDADTARALLAEAGYADGFEIPLLVNADVSDHDDVAVLIRDSLSQIGVDVVIDTKPAAAYLEQANSGDIGIVLHQGYAIVSEIPYHYQLYVSGPTGFLSFGGFNNPRFDAAIAESLSVLPGSERTELVNEVQQILADEVPHLSVVGAPTRYGFGLDIEGYTWYPNNQIWFYDLSRS